MQRIALSSTARRASTARRVLAVTVIGWVTLASAPAEAERARILPERFDATPRTGAAAVSRVAQAQPTPVNPGANKVPPILTLPKREAQPGSGAAPVQPSPAPASPAPAATAASTAQTVDKPEPPTARAAAAAERAARALAEENGADDWGGEVAGSDQDLVDAATGLPITSADKRIRATQNTPRAVCVAGC